MPLIQRKLMEFYPINLSTYHILP
uniref:Uncharacterized protein n=1 Tax=Rhizophora mucronata TaxID=61149 RepID=A0A2P2JBL1_RHIMU